MAFQIIDNIEVPATATTTTRNRARGEFAQTLDDLNVGQGFIFESDKGLKALPESIALAIPVDARLQQEVQAVAGR